MTGRRRGVPSSLERLTECVGLALESSAIDVDVWESDTAGGRFEKVADPLARLTRCLRSAGLLDEHQGPDEEET